MSDFDEGVPQSEPDVPEHDSSSEQSDDPIEETLYTSFMQATATGADASQAFNVAVHAAKQVALSHGIPEDVYERISADMFGPYSAALGEGHAPQESLRIALQSLEG